jgi:hypothetical protein
MKKNNAVDQYNALDGKKVTRKELIKLRDLAVNQLQQHVVDEINEFLLNNPAPFLSAIFEKEYEIGIPKKLTWIPTGTGLGASKYKKVTL